MLIFKNKLPVNNRVAIINKIKGIALTLGIDPNWLMAVINFETAGTFSPSIQNSYTKATGLIQFMPTTALGLNTTVSTLKEMDFFHQLDYVERYYRPYKSKIKSFVDLYLATFFPVAIGKPNNWVLRANGITAQKIAEQNPIFNDGGKVTVGKIKRVILSRIPAQYVQHIVKQNKSILGVLFFFAISYGIYKYAKN